MNKKIEEAFNKQINAELFSAYLYYSMSSYFESIGLKGFAHWMRIQAQEELTHADKFFGFIADRGGRAQLTSIEGPKTNWESPLDAFQDALAHEQKISGLIHKLVDLSLDERDHPSNTFLQWFVSEQVEEESSAHEVIDSLKLAGDGGMLFQLDKDLGQRVFTPPKAEGA